MTTENATPRWNFRMLWLAAIGTLILSLFGFGPGPMRDACEWIDLTIFSGLNGMLPSSAPLWALFYTPAFLLLPGMAILVMFWRFMTQGGPEDRLLERVIGCGMMMSYVAMAGIAAWLLAPSFGRAGPLMLVENAHRISDFVSWMEIDEFQNQSFPSVSGAASIVLVFCLIDACGRRAAWWGGGLVLAIVLPRLVMGIHGFSDFAVGSMLIALPVLMIAFGSPFHRVVVAGLATLLRRWLPWLDPFTRTLISAETPPLVAKGVCMGTADIIPGVSGGTMAYILGIYDRLLGAITIFNPNWFRHLTSFQLRQAIAEIPFFFLMPLCFGIVLAMGIFTRLIPLPYFVHYHPEPVYGLFFGLVGGSAILLLRMHARVCWSHAVTLMLGAALGIAIVSLVPANTPEASWFIFLCGALAISAMLLPGISGSFILLILGKYATILGALGEFNLRVLIPFALGCGIGLLGFAHTLKWLMARYTMTMNLLITGLLIGTLRAVWPFQERTYAEVDGKEKLVTSVPVWPEVGAWMGLAGGMMVIGFVIIYALDRISREKEPASPSQ